MGHQDAIAAFDEVLDELEGAQAVFKPALQTRAFEAAAALTELDEGLSELSKRAHRFESAGLFEGGPWADASRLLPQLVGGGLLADGQGAVIEALSELRVLAIAEDRVSHPVMDSAAAHAFLNAVVLRNLAFLAPDASEDSRKRPATYARAQGLIELLLARLSPASILEALVGEIDALCAQRPIITDRARALIERAGLLLPVPEVKPEVLERLERYQDALTAPSTLSRRMGSRAKYGKALPGLDDDALQVELSMLASAMRETGLGNSHHALLLRHIAEYRPQLLPSALGLNQLGAAALESHLDLARELIDVAIHPETADAIVGLAGVFERALLSRRSVARGLQRLMTLQLHPAVTKALQAGAGAKSHVSANARLVAGTLSVLGQPLGLGQGNNPTCQSARGLSLWSVHAAGYLLGLLTSAARDGTLAFDFEGATLESHLLSGGVASTIQNDLDPVSRVLVPHLDRIYDEMMRRASSRGIDAHRWVNPAFYGRWVPSGFACAIDVPTQTVHEYDVFARRFFATHHPAFNDGDELTYPNPVGVFVTDVAGRLLGAHAVSLRRIEPDSTGGLRAYFFNPNNEGRQNWGQGVVTSVSGFGEIPGESSLPFAHFASRLYAYHYHPHEGGPAEAIPDDAVAEVARAARNSWGRAYAWATGAGLV